MSTRSAIIRQTETGKFEGIYCHSDGYVEEPGVGHTLHHHYQDPDKVAALIGLGDISALHENVSPTGQHSFDSREDGTTCAYHRDRGEPWKDVKPTQGHSVRSVARNIDHQYLYLYDGERPEGDRWFVNGQSLKEVLEEKERFKKSTAHLNLA